MDLCNHFSALKLINKPDSLLLEARRSQTSSEGHNQTSALSLLFELVPVDLSGKNEKLRMFLKGKDFY